MLRHHLSYAGFTLLEILLAIFIFTIVSALVVSGLHVVLHSQSMTDEKAKQLSELQRTLLLMSQDITSSIDRSIINSKGGIDAAFIGTSDSIHLTRAGLANPHAALPRSSLQRVGYRIDNHQLIRETWQVLDQTAKSLPDNQHTMSSVLALQFSFLTEQRQFVDRWPPEGSTQAKLPLGVRVSFTLENWGDITQLYLLPAAGGSIAK